MTDREIDGTRRFRGTVALLLGAGLLLFGLATILWRLMQGWETYAVAVRPDGGAFIEFRQSRNGDHSQGEIWLATDGGVSRLRIHGPAGIGFPDKAAEVAWSADGTKVTVFRCGEVGGAGAVLLGYDLRRGAVAEPSPDDLERKLRAKYPELKAMGEPSGLRWLCSERGHIAFRAINGGFQDRARFAIKLQ